MKETYFIKAATPAEKVAKLVNLVARAYEQGKRIQICCPSEEAKDYVDRLLWREPKDGFLPHEVDDKEARISVCCETKNINRADVAFNLDVGPLEDFEIVLAFEQSV